MKVPGSKIVPCQGVLGSSHSLTFGLFTQMSGSGPLGPLVKLSHESECFHFLGQTFHMQNQTFHLQNFAVFMHLYFLLQLSVI